MATTRTTTSKLTVKITPNDKGNPPGKLADAELHFGDGPLAATLLFGDSSLTASLPLGDGPFATSLPSDESLYLNAVRRESAIGCCREPLASIGLVNASYWRPSTLPIRFV